MVAIVRSVGAGVREQNSCNLCENSVPSANAKSLSSAKRIPFSIQFCCGISGGKLSESVKMNEPLSVSTSSSSDLTTTSSSDYAEVFDLHECATTGVDVENYFSDVLIDQYAQDVVDFSSQYGSDYSISYTALNITGRPCKYPDYGDFPETFAMVSGKVEGPPSIDFEVVGAVSLRGMFTFRGQLFVCTRQCRAKLYSSFRGRITPRTMLASAI